MIATARSEWLKLRTVRVHLVMTVIAVAFPLLVVVLSTGLTSSPTVFGDRGFTELVTGVALVTVLLLGTVAAISLTGEYSHGTIRPTYAATPSRPRVVVAKWLVCSIAVASVAAIVLAITWALGATVLSSRDASVELSWADGTIGALIALVVLAVVLAWFALSIALVVRNAPAAVTLLLVWPLLVENLLSGLGVLIGISWLPRWMPYQAAIGAVQPSPGADTLGRPLALIWFGAVSLVLLALGVLLERRRDA
ncbi:MAG: ABC transporter permease [Ilumatobacteraceae bacterium]